MVDPSIRIDPPLSDRSLKYGRNVVALSSVILVLTHVPHVEVSKFKPFALDFSQGGEIPIWVIMMIVLIYYAVQFYVAARLDLNVWLDAYPFDKRVTTMEAVVKQKAQRKGIFGRFGFWMLGFPPSCFAGR